MSTIDAMPLTVCGIGTTMKGACDLADGDLSMGASSVLLGLCTTNVGGRFQGLDPQSHSKLMKMTCCAATGLAALQGVARFGVGVREKNWAEIFRGGLQTAAGVVGSLFVHSLDPKTIVVANQASATALGSAFIAKLGWQDLVKGRYLSGVSKVLLGTAGVASAVWYAYSSYFDKPALSAEQIAFLESHKTEIEEMYVSKATVGNWKELGKGSTKIALVHPDLPDMLVKILGKTNGFNPNAPDEGLFIHYHNLQEIQTMVKENAFDRIVIPQSHLFPTSKGIALVEQRLNLFPSEDIPNDPDKDIAIAQFSQLVQKSRLLDLTLEYAHNCGFIKLENHKQIGIIDFDLRGDIWDLASSNDLRKKLRASSVCSLGFAVLGGISAMAKRISNIKVLRYGLQAGLLGGVLSLSDPFSTYSHLCINTIEGMGVGMLAASTILAPLVTINGAYSWIKKSLESLVPKFNSPFAGSIG